MLQNAYLASKIGADTAENERNVAEICQKNCNYRCAAEGRADALDAGLAELRGEADALRTKLQVPANARWNFTIFCRFLAGSFSVVSKRNVASKYAFDSIVQDLQDVRTFAALQTQHFSKTLV